MMSSTNAMQSHGLVLAGGGAYAAYEVGVMKALCAGKCSSTQFEPLDPAVLTGTSAGAFNAAAIVSLAEDSVARSIQDLERIWVERIAQQPGSLTNGLFHSRLGLQDWLTLSGVWQDPTVMAETAAKDVAYLVRDLARRISRAFRDPNGSMAQQSLSFVDLAAFVTVEPFEHVIRDTIRPSAIRCASRAIRVVATDWQKGAPRIFSNGDFDDETGGAVVLASAAIPGLFPPVTIGDSVYVDGSVLMNTPLLPAIDAGADVLHVIYLDPDVKLIDVSRLNNIFTVLDRVLLIGRADIFERDIAQAATVNRSLELLRLIESHALVAYQAPAAQAMRFRHGRAVRDITIHRYHPTEDFGDIVGALDVDREHITGLIDRGFSDAVRHDCNTAGCVTG